MLPGRRLGSLAAVALALAAATVSGCRFELGEDEDLQASVETTLARSAEAWNRGDVDEFLGAFADQASTTFIADGGPVMNRAQLEAAVARLAAGTSGARIRFDDMAVRPLPPLIGIVTGRFEVAYDDASDRPTSGSFTAVVRRVSDGWKITHAHASWTENR